jgi:Luciferase-like monooxygenase
VTKDSGLQVSPNQRPIRERVGLVVDDANAAATNTIAAAEAAGVRQIWMSQPPSPPLWPDILTTLGAAASKTSTVRLGTSIVPTYPRHPLVLAQQSLALNGIAPGAEVSVCLSNIRCHRTLLRQAIEYLLGTANPPKPPVYACLIHSSLFDLIAGQKNKRQQLPQAPGSFATGHALATSMLVRQRNGGGEHTVRIEVALQVHHPEAANPPPTQGTASLRRQSRRRILFHARPAIAALARRSRHLSRAPVEGHLI